MGHDLPPLPLRDVHAVRWYVLSLPACHKGPAKGLKKELDRRVRLGEPTFDFFAPLSWRCAAVKGIWWRLTVRCSTIMCLSALLYMRIFRLKRDFPLYNFLPSVDGRGSYPFVSDREMENLRWVARSYSDELPVYVPEAGYLRKGDRIRITDGRFKGVEASVVIQPGVGEREVMVCVDNWMWVPLLRVQPGEYEVISLAEEGKHVYTRLDNSRIQNGLHEEALGRHWGS